MEELFTYVSGNKDILVVNFSSKGLLEADKVVPEFVRTFTILGYNSLYVLDITKSWFQDVNIQSAIKNKITDVINNTKPKKIVFMGLSMGGFGAILFSKFFKCDKVIAFVPQIDLLYEHKIGRYKKTLPPQSRLSIPTVVDYFQEETQYMLYAGTVDDRKQLSFVKESPNIDKLYISNSHNVCDPWKTQGILIDKFRELIEGI